MFHKHQWQITGKYYTQPTEEVKHITNVTSKLARDLMFGFTCIEQTCLRCGKTRFDKVEGNLINGKGVQP